MSYETRLEYRKRLIAQEQRQGIMPEETDEAVANADILHWGVRYIKIHNLLGSIGGMDSQWIDKLAFSLWVSEQLDDGCADKIV